MMDEIRLTITAGAGGPESEAWASMLLKMYVRWCARNGVQIEPGREIARTDAGIKWATLSIEGDGVGKLRGEDGIHRLVRVSPFDSQARRHTSFAAVETTPAVDGHAIGPPRERRSQYWGGGQIRSYVLHPYTIAKDLRTGIERKDVDAVLDGDIDDFLDGAAAQGLDDPKPRDDGAAVMDCA